MGEYMKKEIKTQPKKYNKAHIWALICIFVAVTCALLFSIWATVYVAKENDNAWILADCVFVMAAAASVVWYAIFGHKHGNWTRCIPLALIAISLCVSIGTDGYSDGDGDKLKASLDCFFQALLIGVIVFAGASYKKPKVAQIAFTVALIMSIALCCYWCIEIGGFDDWSSKQQIAWSLWCWSTPALICSMQVSYILDNLKNK